ncbi:MAG: B12-binding domain-containing radical SAM protein [Candidatus Hydrogenedentes bacterium]|nr:B12-binding domain-containing radical SAM protein [Candidatus Hydrogenedentota bacterium]
MKILFVLPPFDLSASFGSSTKMKRGFLPSLGVGYIAGILQSQGHETALLDAQVTDLNPLETVEGILEEDPDIIGLSVMGVYAHAAYAVAAELKARAPGILIVAGGPHCTSNHVEVLNECPQIDVVIPGEGEYPMAEIVAKISAKEDYRDVKGIAYRTDDGKVLMNGHGETAKNLDDLPHPARHIYNGYAYRPLPNQVRHEPATTSITSRGCSWGKCTFCFQGGKYSSQYRRRSPRNVVEELIPLVREHGIREIGFWDDTFAVNPRWINDFCDELDREKLNITWTCYGHMRSVRPDMLKRMARSGCYNLYYGFESGVQEILDMVKKGTTRQRIRDAVKWAKQAGIEVRGSFILGFPTETPEQSLETIKFACELNADWMIFYPFHVMPGTPIEALAHQDGRLLDDLRLIHFPEFVSSGYTDVEQVHNMVQLAYKKYYLRPRYWALVARNLAKRPYMFKYYYDALKFWLDLTSGGGRMAPIESSDEATPTTT